MLNLLLNVEQKGASCSDENVCKANICNAFFLKDFIKCLFFETIKNFLKIIPKYNILIIVYDWLKAANNLAEKDHSAAEKEATRSPKMNTCFFILPYQKQILKS